MSAPATAKAAKTVEASPSAGPSSSFNFTFDKSNAKLTPASASQTTGSRPTEQTNGSEQSRPAAPPNSDEFPGFVSDEEEVRRLHSSALCQYSSASGYYDGILVPFVTDRRRMTRACPSGCLLF